MQVLQQDKVLVDDWVRESTDANDWIHHNTPLGPSPSGKEFLDLIFYYTLKVVILRDIETNFTFDRI